LEYHLSRLEELKAAQGLSADEVRLAAKRRLATRHG
jgi:hypothetical protein